MPAADPRSRSMPSSHPRRRTPRVVATAEHARRRRGGHRRRADRRVRDRRARFERRVVSHRDGRRSRAVDSELTKVAHDRARVAGVGRVPHVGHGGVDLGAGRRRGRGGRRPGAARHRVARGGPALRPGRRSPRRSSRSRTASTGRSPTPRPPAAPAGPATRAPSARPRLGRHAHRPHRDEHRSRARGGAAGCAPGAADMSTPRWRRSTAYENAVAVCSADPPDTAACEDALDAALDAQKDVQTAQHQLVDASSPTTSC